jgi:hypothetical protein
LGSRFATKLCAIQDLLSRADEAMWPAKADGKNTWEFYTKYSDIFSSIMKLPTLKLSDDLA